MIRHVWLALLEDENLDIPYYIWALQLYIASVSAGGIVLESSLTVLLTRVLCRQRRYSELIQLIQTKFLPTSTKLGFEILATSIAREKDTICPNRLREMGLLQNYGIEMLWRREVSVDD